MAMAIEIDIIMFFLANNGFHFVVNNIIRRMDDKPTSMEEIA